MSRHDETDTTATRRVARRSPTTLVRLAMLAVSGTLCVATADAQTLPAAGETGGPVKGLTHQEYRLFLKGRKVFDRDFDLTRGLGTPELNADSCRACHEDPILGGTGGLELNVSRFGNDNGGLGPFVNLPGGQAVSKMRPTPENTRENYPVGNADPLQNADVFEQRQTPTAFGIGAIQTIPASAILANADPDDLNGDGIKGVARILTIAGQEEVGRLGWKAQVPLVKDFARDAMGGELGITTPDDGRGFAFVTDEDTVADPELSTADLDALIFFLENLAPPKPALQGGPLAAPVRLDVGEAPAGIVFRLQRLVGTGRRGLVDRVDDVDRVAVGEATLHRRLAAVDGALRRLVADHLVVAAAVAAGRRFVAVAARQAHRARFGIGVVLQSARPRESWRPRRLRAPGRRVRAWSAPPRPGVSRCR